VKRIRISIDPSDLVLEIISIVVAILLALTVNFFAGQFKSSGDVRNALASIASEMTANAATIDKLHPLHLRKCTILQSLARRGRGRKITYSAYQNALDGVLPFAPPPSQSTAWDLAESSGVSANFPYATRAAIARVYAQQRAVDRLASDLAVDFRPLIFARDADFFLVARNAALDCTYVTSGEDRLAASYGREANALR
jgi:hypothetical protein